MLVPREVKWEVLRKFVDKCCVLHAVAFFQWRMKFPSSIRHDEAEIIEIIEGRINHHNKNFKELEISQTTIDKSKIAQNFLVKYEFVDEYKPYFINSFASLGLSDPYPHDDEFITGSLDDGESMKMPEKVDDLVYPESRLIPEYSPFCIYIPKKEIMLKLMRSTIMVKKKEDLWVNQ